ncbi:hypothetical protein D3C85_1339450 [compost metagenome]
MPLVDVASALKKLLSTPPPEPAPLNVKFPPVSGTLLVAITYSKTPVLPRAVKPVPPKPSKPLFAVPEP